MPDLSVAEKLQPSLLDRLTDVHPHERKESRTERVLSVRRLRECVRRDLGWLLNCTNLEMVEDLTGFDEAKASVINFGVPELTGRTVSGLQIDDIAAMLKEAILRFEPRILRDTLEIRGSRGEGDFSDRSLTFEIHGQMWAQPMPQELYLQTELDLELGEFRVSER